LSQPAPLVPEWEPIPIYQEDLPTPKPETKPKEESAPRPSPTSDKDILDSVNEMITPTPAVPPFAPPVPEPTMDTVEIPFTNFEVPVPPQEILVTAVTTAGASAVVAVGATLAATRVFEQLVKIFKPLFKTALKKLAKMRKQKPPLTWARQRLVSRQRTVRRRVNVGQS
jgi:cell pole-organizing protein PopZ